MKKATETPKTIALANACLTGACNTYALVGALADVREELGIVDFRTHPAVKVIIGQISFLIGESLGPTSEALTEYNQWTLR